MHMYSQIQIGNTSIGSLYLSGHDIFSSDQNCHCILTHIHLYSENEYVTSVFLSNKSFPAVNY